MADLPSELFTEILSRLPVQSLLRFRSTSKSLKFLIDSHNFTNLHLKNSLNFNLILCHNSKFYQVDFPNLTTTVLLNQPLTRFSFNNITLLCSCNGALCISNGKNQCALWNPNIRKHCFIRYLPISRYAESETEKFLVCVYGLAFDPFADNYKLLRINCTVYLKDRSFSSQVRLFNLKTNSWKVLPNMPYAVLSTSRMGGVFVENSLHWVMTEKINDRFQPCLIVAFNLTQEIFNEVPLPEIQASASQHFRIDVSLFEEYLCMIVSYHTLSYQTDKVDVWLMKEYGVRDSWCKLFTLAEWRFSIPLIYLKPLCYFSDRNMILLKVYDNKLFWYDLKSEKVTCVLGLPNFHEAVICAGSLLPPSLPSSRKRTNPSRKRNYKQEKV